MMADAQTTPGNAALEVVSWARARQFDEIHDRVAAPLQSIITAEVVAAGWDAALAQFGHVAEVGAPSSDPGQGGTATVRVPITGERGDFTVLITLTRAGAVAGLQIAPAEAGAPVAEWQPPDYADQAVFTESNVTLLAGSLAVGATLTTPNGTPTAGVVLVAGSGPQDRDATFGRNKIFKDMAWGLATRGVTVLRFDKVTLTHADILAANAALTLTDEYVPNAVAAIRFLRAQPGVDPERIFVLGHSLGGTVAPRVAEAEPAVAGLILLAAGAQPLHWAAVRQSRYLASLQRGGSAAAAAAIDALERQARLVDSPELSAATPPADLPFGVPAAYWLDLRSYQPTTTAVRLGKPILVLQGGRDYQVTVANDLQRWRAALAGLPGITSHVYEADDHFFFSGVGPPGPGSYEPAQHLDPAVIADICDWIDDMRPPADRRDSSSPQPTGR